MSLTVIAEELRQTWRKHLWSLQIPKVFERLVSWGFRFRWAIIVHVYADVNSFKTSLQLFRWCMSYLLWNKRAGKFLCPGTIANFIAFWLASLPVLHCPHPRYSLQHANDDGTRSHFDSRLANSVFLCVLSQVKSMHLEIVRWSME